VLLAREAQSRMPGVTLAIPVSIRLLADQLTPVVAYRRLVAPDDRTAPSFLLESVEGGERQGRYSIMGARPKRALFARGDRVEMRESAGIERFDGRDPLDVLREACARVRLVRPAQTGTRAALPACALGGWFGYAAYDAVRYAEPSRLGFDRAPRDDRNLADVHFAFHDSVVVIDHVDRVVHVVQLAIVEPGGDAGAAYDAALACAAAQADALEHPTNPPVSGRFVEAGRGGTLASNLDQAEHASMVARAKAYIGAGDVFQVVLGQRFERLSRADPFDVYRALRTVNPSPYMVYMQAHGCILVASSPEILCRVRRDGASLCVTNRPLAGTRRRGSTPAQDETNAAELLADPKERAEHIMLVDLGRNDVGRVAVPGSVRLAALMEIERYSHVMHISSTVEGRLRDGLDAFDALRAALPVGTISGAPKVRAMEIIDELEPIRRGPYGGGIGYIGLDGQMDIALTLRTMVVPTAMRSPEGWTYHLQASGGIVADSDPNAEFQETVNKAAALATAIDVAERAFGGVERGVAGNAG